MIQIDPLFAMLKIDLPDLGAILFFQHETDFAQIDAMGISCQPLRQFGLRFVRHIVAYGATVRIPHHPLERYSDKTVRQRE